MSIQEIHTLKTAFDRVCPKTLLVLDLDDTLIRSNTHYGSHQWLSHQIKLEMSRGMELKQALNEHISSWHALQDQLELICVEAQAPHWLMQLKHLGVDSLALTGRSSLLKKCTLKGLKNLGYQFSKFDLPSLFMPTKEDIDHHEGIIFVGHQNCKGEVLSHFLDQVTQKYAKVIFIDDMMGYLKKVMEAMQLKQIPFEGYHYTRCLQEPFDPEQAQREEKLFFKSR